MIGELRSRYGITRPIWLMPILESALAIENASAIAAVSKCGGSHDRSEDYTRIWGLPRRRRRRDAVRAMRLVNCREGGGNTSHRFGFWRRGRHGRLAKWAENHAGWDSRAWLRSSRADSGNFMRGSRPRRPRWRGLRRLWRHSTRRKSVAGRGESGSKMIDAPVVERARNCGASEVGWGKA